MKPDRDQLSIVPAIMPGSFSDIEKGVERYASFAPRVQLDVMDSVFVPRASWPYGDGEWQELEQLAEGKLQLPQHGAITYEAHLMVGDPERIGELLARGGVECLIVHVESLDDVDFPQMCASWRAARAKEIGLAILADTPVEMLASYIDQAQFIQVMGIKKVGFQGEPFDHDALGKVRAIRALFPSVPIEFDGGVGMTTIGSVIQSGASRIVVGSVLEQAADPEMIYRTLVEAAVDNAVADTTEGR